MLSLIKLSPADEFEIAFAIFCLVWGLVACAVGIPLGLFMHYHRPTTPPLVRRRPKRIAQKLPAQESVTTTPTPETEPNQQITILKADARRYQEALRFYADNSNFDGMELILQDGGQKARSALSTAPAPRTQLNRISDNHTA